MGPVESTSYSWAYLDPKWGWVSGGQHYTDHGHCMRKALLHLKTTGNKVQMSTMTTVTTVEDLPLPGHS